ncbi:MAG: peptide ABC transporter permease [Alteromonadaceae bacterium]|jgi:cationic peptide transport system permease protein|uniref:ABC transporter permease subunit n=1 Tax=Rheinheimera aquimaris TaxID=412437 RepID=A0ABP3NVS5_9GAMM|nr:MULTISPECIES: ABC transporter permease subunit [Rheinheimera]MBJ91220.1 peptide ABC transporter permease [Alteromonadaceae bacterium]MCB5213821.1 ABC transporter permease subunit [Rheinheimera aquimaris]MCD1597997.1 ABC transporter permease subunit [Rheinheimera aquimaris]|tara:strand:- start:13842 stop:14738 length:897 start_codon:yes stop_codon:yes gene_type:complete
MAKFRLLPDEQLARSPVRQLWREFSRHHSAVAGLLLFIIFFLLALMSPLISPHDPYLQNDTLLLLPPSWSEQGLVQYPFGTDDLGRDLFSRLLVGARYTFGIAIITVLGALIMGLLLGTLAGMSKGVKSSIFNHVLDLALTIPSLLLAIIIVAILGPGLQNTTWAIMLALLPQFVHGIRNAIAEQLNQDYVVAYRLDGANNWQVFSRIIMPNIWERLTLMATMALSTATLDIAALGFLGLGAQAPSAEWGAIIGDSLDLIYIAPVSVAVPGLLIFMAVLSVNLVGDGLRNAAKKRREN